jgi:hypothetical protein
MKYIKNKNDDYKNTRINKTKGQVNRLEPILLININT